MYDQVRESAITLLLLPVSVSLTLFVGPRLVKCMDPRANMFADRLQPQTNPWKEQFIEAFTVRAGNGDEEGRPPSCIDYLLHIVCLFWKILFAFIPPCTYWNGWPRLILSLFAMGVFMDIFVDLSSCFGSFVGLGNSVTLVTIFVFGTFLPLILCNENAGTQYQHVDASTGKVMKRNTVRAFLGFKVACYTAAMHFEVHNGEVFYVDPNPLASSVTLFIIWACIILGPLVLRLKPSICIELVGPHIINILISTFLCGLQLLCILL